MKNMLIHITNILKNFYKYMPLLFELVRRDLSKKYRRSVLGYAWSLLNPIFMMIVLTIVFSYLFKNDIENFPLYLILGQTTWGLFADATNTAMKSINGGGELLKKIYVPKYIFPLSKTLFALVNMSFSLIAVIIVIIFTRTPIKITAVLFPLALIYTFLFATGIGLILCVLDVYFKDTEHLYSVFLLAWMYFTPIFYPVRRLPAAVQNLMRFNPMYQNVTYMRTVILYGEVPSLKQNVICLACGIVSMCIGTFLFYKKQDGFILHI